MSKEEKFSKLKNYIFTHLGDDFNNLYSFPINDRFIIAKLDAIYNKFGESSMIIFKELSSDSLIELKADNMPDYMKSINHNENIF